MQDIIQVENQYYVLATSSLADDRTRVLKYGETFAVFNRLGDGEGLGLGEQGLYHRGTRHLSRLALRMGGSVPQLLRSTIQEDGAFFTLDMMNPDVYIGGHLSVPRGSVHLFRSKFLWKSICYEKLRLSTFCLTPLDTSLNIQFAADYADIFQVRGVKRHQMGTLLPPEVTENSVVFSYHGRDGKLRCTRLEFSPAPEHLTEESAAYSITLAPREETSITIAVVCEQEARAVSISGFNFALEESANELAAERVRFASVSSTHLPFNRWMSRAQADVVLMTHGNPEGAYPYAGVPWFSAVFGRDGLITAMQCLWAAPWIAESVLRHLARYQAVEVIPEQEAEPGKILHEMRHGEMANLKEVPFGLYYGSVDSTPLFLLLAGMYAQRTGNLEFVKSIWPNILAALDWIDQFGDSDHDGFVEYRAKTEKGLIQQGWKDSHDAVFHADGELAVAPIALCEVQSYVYGAKLAVAGLAAQLGQKELASDLTAQAQALREKFEAAFWDESLGAYVLALDGEKKPCRVVTSNAGHTLLTGIAGAERAARLVTTLMDERLYCGWGIRTLASNEVRYNPMAYHNGSVWPHDNAVIAQGLARYGYKAEAARLLTSLLDASTFMELNRLPELFCGFHKRAGVEGPTLYPVACSPQAWAAGAAYSLLAACLGLHVSAVDKTLRFTKPFLPDVLNSIEIRGIEIADGKIDLRISQESQGIRIQPTGRASDIVIDVQL